MSSCSVPSCNVAPLFVAIIVGLVILTLLIITIVITWIYCKIFAKAGYCWALGLLTLVPIVNIVMLCVLGLGDWPVLKELRQLKQQTSTDKPQGT